MTFARRDGLDHRLFLHRTMSSRKKPRPLSTKKQPLIESYFSSKSKTSAVPTPKRLVQTSLRPRPLRASKSPAKEEILDLTRSTSPLDGAESPPSSKKRRLEPGPSSMCSSIADHSMSLILFIDHSPERNTPRDPLGSSLSPMTEAPDSPPSRSHQIRQTPPRLEERVKSMTISPSPLHIRHLEHMMVDDPNEVVESSQTQYLHLIFTPPSQRNRTVDVLRNAAPAGTPASTSQRAEGRADDQPSVSRNTRSPSVASSQGQIGWRIPSSQGEVSEPRTPRKRRRALMDQSGVSSIHLFIPLLLPSSTAFPRVVRRPDLNAPRC